MHFAFFFVAIATASAAGSSKNKTAKADSCAMTALTTEFSAGFKQPNPPEIEAEFGSSFVQHRWNQKMSIISSGYITNSPSQGFVRADEAFNGTLTSSFFNYNNMTCCDMMDMTQCGMVDNNMTTYNPNVTHPKVWRGYDNTTFPMFTKNMLITGGAVFTGHVTRDFSGRGMAWNIIYEGRIPLTVYVDACNVVIGFDYFLRDQRTRVVTELFNTKVLSSEARAEN